MKRHLTRSLRAGLVSLGLTLLGHVSAHAGLVTGRWDPEFGPFLPNLSWQVRAELLVPNTCASQADGIYSTASGNCSGTTIQNIWLRLFDTGQADRDDFFGYDPESAYWILGPSFSGSGGISNLRVQGGTVVGAQTAGLAYPQSAYTIFPNPTPVYSAPPSAEGNLFSLGLGVYGPTLTCLDCRAALANPINPADADQVAGIDDLTQYLVTYLTDDTSAPKFIDQNGNAAGAQLDADGALQGFFRADGTPVTNPIDASRPALPEPGTLVLVFAALAAGAVTHRRCR